MRALYAFAALAAFVLTSASAPVASAQTTGQISGVVRDGQTGETLPGANVRIDGTTTGASTNIDGEFRIIGVRPGSYDLVASFVGFTPTRLEGVRVNVDLTTNVEFDLRLESFEGQEITVRADANLVRRDLTSSESRVTSESIANLPVQEIGDILRTQAGVTTSGAGIHIRGGRSKEVAYFVDGVRVTDSYDGSVAVQIENEGIEELQIISGTYNAEYGQANSGIINVVTKDPGREFEGSFEAFSGSYLVTGDGGADALRGINVAEYERIDEIPYIGVDPFSYLDVDPVTYSNISGSLSGPIIPDRLGFFGLVRYFENDGFLFGARNVNVDGTPGDSSLVNLNDYEKISGQTTLKLKINDRMNASVTALASRALGNDLSGGQGFSFRFNPDGIARFQDDGLNVNAQFTHTLSNSAFYTLNASTFRKSFSRGAFDSVEEYNQNLTPDGRNPSVFLIETPEFVGTAFDDSGAPTDSIRVVAGGNRFLRGGLDLGRFERRTQSNTLKADLTWQVLPEHLAKMGVEVRRDDIFLQSFSLIQDPVDNNQLVVPDRIRSNLFQEIDGVRPLNVSAYIQDKAEYENFIVNAGLRFDFFNSDGEVPRDPQDPNVFVPQKPINRFRDLNGDGVIQDEEAVDSNLTTLEERLPNWYEDAESKYQISPRLGVAYPITSSGVIHFSYGYFFQIPTYEFLFQNPGYRVGTTAGTYGPYGNPNLDAQKTVMYEIGLQQGFGDDYLLDVTGFYRDIEDWVSVSFPIDAALPGVNYLNYTNLDFSNVRGITAALSKRFNDRFSFDVDYTYQIADGSNSDPNDAITARQGGEAPRLQVIPLNWDQRHTFNASVFTGGKSWGTSLIARLGSGYPYTPSLGRNPQDVGVLPAVPNNASRRPSSATVDLYAFKSFNVGPATPRVFFQVYNLLDARNVNGVFGDTGLPDVTFVNASLAQDDPGYYVRPDFYAEPRRLQLGVEVNF